MLVPLLGSALLVAAVIMMAFPRTPTARVLHRLLVEPPATFLLDFTWKKLAAMLLVAMFAPVLVLAGPEMLAMFALLGGDAAAIELMIVVAGMSVTGGFAAAWRQVRTAPFRLMRFFGRVLRPGPRPRTSGKRIRRQRPPKDDSAPGGWAFA